MISAIKKIAYVSFFVLPIALSSSAFAASEGAYGNVSGGATYIPNNIRMTSNGFTYSDASYKTGLNVGTALGYKSGPIRYEGELRYLRASLKEYRVDNFPALNPEGKVQTTALLANLYYDFDDVANNFTPFVGAGIGAANVRTKLTSFSVAPDIRNSDTRLAYKGTAGINIGVSDNIALSIAYVYLGTTATSTGKRFQSHSANLGIGFSFDS